MGKESSCNVGDTGNEGQSLGQEGSLEEKIATHSSILAWKIQWIEEPGRLESKGQTELDIAEYIHTRLQQVQGLNLLFFFFLLQREPSIVSCTQQMLTIC